MYNRIDGNGAVELAKALAVNNKLEWVCVDDSS